MSKPKNNRSAMVTVEVIKNFIDKNTRTRHVVPEVFRGRRPPPEKVRYSRQRAEELAAGGYVRILDAPRADTKTDTPSDTDTEGAD
jgi:hypothetical protein